MLLLGRILAVDLAAGKGVVVVVVVDVAVVAVVAVVLEACCSQRPKPCSVSGFAPHSGTCSKSGCPDAARTG